MVNQTQDKPRFNGAPKAVAVPTCLPRELLNEMDIAARRSRLSRSAWVRICIGKALDGEPKAA